MAEDELDAGLHERARRALDRSRLIGRRAAILLEASQYSREASPRAPRCTSCGRIAVAGEWLSQADVPDFVLRTHGLEFEPGICPDCFGTNGDAGASLQRQDRLTIHPGGRRASDALVEALRDYGAKRRPDGVLEIELGDRGAAAVNGLLTLVADCLRDLRLDPVQVRLTDRSYTLDGR